MAFENLSEREKHILQALINHYIATAEPVGSRAIAQRYKLGVSPATIRNTMQDLEELGLISQPHTSAGRIPTDKGYRFYVDSMMGKEVLTPSEEDQIRREICADYAAVQDILDQTARVLATVSKQLGVTIAPRFDKGIITGINLIPVADRKILVVLTVKHGLVRSILLEAESNIDIDQLERTQSVLNERLAGLTLGEIAESIGERLKETSDADPRLIKLFLDSADNLLKLTHPDQMHLGGTKNIVDQPEFKDREKLRGLIEVLEERKLLAELVSTKGIKEGITITIGKEIERGEMQSCSLVTSPYKTGKVSGTIGIIGPTRMRYSKLASMVEYAAKLLGEVLSK